MTITITESIKCDSCAKELIRDTKYPAIYALEVNGIDVNRNSSNETYLSAVYKPKTLHFCGNACIVNYYSGEAI